MRPYKPYIPQSVGEIIEQLEWMGYHTPTFEDPSFDELYPGRDLKVVFYELREGLNVNRKALGEGRYLKAIEVTDRMRAYFESHPDDGVGQASEGTKLIEEMTDLLKGRMQKPEKGASPFMSP